MTNIHLVFKTHLDIGFTDLAAKVRAQYHERFIPQALETGEHFFRENPERPAFIWTTGAWLIHDHLATQPRDSVARLERAIERGLIRWHALPFTVHSELMSPALFRAGLSFSRELDQRFGVTTTAAKMTDVPGHTRGVVPLLAEAGVRFLHLGVNSASPVPDVPPLFRWQAPDGSEVVVMYQSSYGETTFPDGMADGLSFAHTNDNIGPQSVPQVADVYRHLAAEHPGVDVRASTLDAFGELAWAARQALPVLDMEIGDTWIHGSAADPVKTARFRALQRLYDDFAAAAPTPQRLAFGRGLTLVAEHTCGIDVKSYLRDETAWDRPAFEAARADDYRFTFAERSWAEQRGYLDAAIAELDAADRDRAEAAVIAFSRADDEDGDLMGWTVTHDRATGDIATITAPDGFEIAGGAGSLLGYRYESYDAGDVGAHLDSYLTQRVEWAILDHAKPGLERARTARSAAFVPRREGDRIILDPLAHETLGAPDAVQYRVRALDTHRLEVSVHLIGKPASRMPEAGFVTFTPAGHADWMFEKLGLWQPGDRIARRGGGQLQAVMGVRSGRLDVRPLDTPLVGPVHDPFMPFSPEPPDLSRGLRFNLHNNKWGTNFPMWWGGDLVARFILSITGT